MLGLPRWPPAATLIHYIDAFVNFARGCAVRSAYDYTFS